MSETTGAARLIDEACRALEPAGGLAARGGSADLEACRTHLERAVRLLEAALALMRQPARAGSAAAQALERFGSELRRVTALHQHAAGFYHGLMRALAETAGAAYSPRDGDVLPMLVHSGRRISLEA